MKKSKKRGRPIKSAAAKPKDKPKGEYSVELKINDKFLKAEGTSVLDALNNLNLNYETALRFKTKAIFHFKKGKRIHDQYFLPYQMRKMFNKFNITLVRRFWAAKVEKLLNR